MSIGEVVVGVTRFTPRGHKLDAEHGWRSGASRLGAVGVVEFHVLAGFAAACWTVIDVYIIVPTRTTGDNCKQSICQVNYFAVAIA